MENVLPIVKEPNRILRKKAAEVRLQDISGPKIQKLILQMKATLKNTPDGVGLAAPQVGVSSRIFIVSGESEEINRKGRPQKGGDKPYETRDWEYHVYINPTVKNISKKKVEDAEGCLSVPGKFGPILRHEKITVEAYDEHGKKFVRGASKFYARVLQHELDHLGGILFIDKAENLFESKA